MIPSVWPTQLDAAGKAPGVMHLMGSDNLLLARQAAFLLFTGRNLKENGYEIETFQQPLGGVTIPLVMRNKKGLAAAVYTQSEAWTPETIAGLSTWIAALRSGGVEAHVPVIVVSQTDSAEVKALPTIFQFIHWPQEHLPGSKGTE